jgi:hypothetical protein
LARLEAEVGDEFDVLGLGKHVERDDAFQSIGLVFREDLEVTGEGGGVAGDVEDLGGALLTEELEGGAGATTSRWVKDEGCSAGVELGEDTGEEFFDTTEEEFAIGAVAAFGVLAGGPHGGFIHLDTCEGFQVLGHFEAEETDTAVGVDEVAAASFLQALADCVDESGKQVEIVLEEGVGRDGPVRWEDAHGDLESAAGWGIEPGGFELGIEFGFGDGAGGDIDNEAVLLAEESEDEALFRFIPLAADHDTVAITVGFGAGNDGVDGDGLEAADAVEEIGNLLAFYFELFGVVEVLVLAATAFPEVGAGGGHTIWRRGDQVYQSSAAKAFFDFGDFHEGGISRGGERDKEDEVAMAGDALAAEGHAVDGYFDLNADLDGG